MRAGGLAAAAGHDTTLEAEMKTQNVTTALAFLVAAFMWGCQEQGSSPVGPDGLGPQFDKKGSGDCFPKPHQEHCHNGDGGKGGKVKFTLVNVSVGGGMQAAVQEMELEVKEDVLRLAARPPVKLKIAMINTRKLNFLTECFQTGSGAPNDALAATLFEKLVLNEIDDTHDVFVLIDTRVLDGPSEDHRIVIFGDGIKVQDAPMVTAGDISGDFTATFSGGNIELTGIPTGGNFGSHVHLTCPIQTGDDITFDVVR